MVRLIPVAVGGKIVYEEDAPEFCSAGHKVLAGWGPCPGCRRMLRYWKCGEACGAAHQFDDEHECPAGTLRA
jgi:hypothetical protein